MVAKALLLAASFLFLISIHPTLLADQWFVDRSVAESGDGRSWNTAFQKIQEGIDAAKDRDTVTVACGTYVENIYLDGKNIILTSTNPVDPDIVASTIIDGNEAGSVVTFSGTEDETCLLEGFTVRNGSATNGGGISGGTPGRQTRAAIKNNLITKNSGWDYGGGLCGCNGTIENNTISGNLAYQGGGLYGCDGTIRNNIISENSGDLSGGGLYGCQGTIENNTIAGNLAGVAGGLYDCDGTIRNNVIVDNTADERGGGLFVCDGVIQGNLIAGNTAMTWGGGLGESKGATIINNTVVGNSAWQGGGLLNCEGTIANCVIWGNTAPDGPQYVAEDPTHSCVQGWSGDERNTAEDPRFVDTDGPDDDPYTYDDNDYRLLPDSPCIDAGMNEDWMWDAVDLDGNPRIIQGRSSLTVDMGAYEFRLSPPVISVSQTSLSNWCEEGSDAESQSFEVWNSGGGTLTYAINANVTWLSCSPAGGTSAGERDVIEVTYTTSDLSAGIYPATITITAPGASNTPLTIPLALTVNETGTPAISLNVTSLTSFCDEGNDAESQSFEVWNSGKGTLSYSISSDVGWLSCAPTDGTSAGEHDSIKVNYATSGLSAGPYWATITVNASAAGNTPQTIPVTMVVNGVLPPAIWHVDASVGQSGDGTSWEEAFKKIQDGIDAASDGDTVVVAEGRYVENIHFQGKNIVLRSTDPLDPAVVANTIIDGNEEGSVVAFAGTEGETCVLAGFTITGGGGVYYGGGIIGGTPARQTHATIRNNVIAHNSGSGAVCGCDGLIESNTIARNSAWQGGGLYGCDGTVRNNVITHNSAELSGGGLFGCQGMIRGNTITGNSAGRGGGLYDSDGTIEGNVIIHNFADEDGGGLYDSDGEIRNNVIAGNSAVGGGGLCYSAEATVRNNTVVGNSAWRGGGLLNCGGTIVNCIIWGNSAPDSPQLTGCGDLAYSCVQDRTWGERNTAEDPQFLDADGPDDDPYTYEDNDYRLLPDSPCIDAGMNEDWMWDAVDLDGNPRIIQGRSSLTVDMGAYEFRLSPPMISVSQTSLSNWCEEGSDAESQTFDVWNSGGGTLSYTIDADVAWLNCDPTSGTSTGEHDTITVNYPTSGLEAGTYQATITIAGPGGEATNSPQTIEVALTVLEVVLDEQTVLLLHCNGEDASTDFVDSSCSNHDVTAHDAAQIDTNEKKYGTGSGLFDGTGDYLSISDTDDWDFGEGDFTIEAWVRLPNTTGGSVIGSEWNENGCWDFYVNGGDNHFGFRGYYTNGTFFDIADTGLILSLNTWHHLAAVRAGNTLTIYVDGEPRQTEDCSGRSINAVSTTGISVGTRTGEDVSTYSGWVDELRISKGVARWTSDFTPPTEEYYNCSRILTIEVSPLGSGTAIPTVGGHVYECGAVVSIDASASAGWAFNHWDGPVDRVATEQVNQVTMDADKTVTAVFVREYTLTMAVTPADAGTTTPRVGAHVYKAGTAVEINATANAGWAFDHWDGPVDGVSTERANRVTVDADKAVTAVFVVPPETITCEVVPNVFDLGMTPTIRGQITPGREATVNVDFYPPSGLTVPRTALSHSDGSYTFNGYTPDQAGEWTVRTYTNKSMGDNTRTFTVRKGDTVMTCGLLTENPIVGNLVEVRVGVTPNVGEITVHISVVRPDSSVFDATDVQMDTAVGYDYYFIPDASGIWRVSVSWDGNQNYNPASLGTDISVGEDIGRLIIVAGSNASGVLQSNINYCTDRAYQLFSQRGFSDEKIYYMNPDPHHNANVDAESTSANFQYAIETWAASHVNATIPLILYMMDHGGKDKFCINKSERTSASDLASWLATLRSATGCTNITVIYAACYSGTFLDELASENLITVTSTGSEKIAYPSQHGEFFSDLFFTEIANGERVGAAFDAAREGVHKLTYGSQTPWLDDNADGVYNSADGELAAQRALGITLPGFDEMPIVVAVSSDQRIGKATSATFWAEVSDAEGLQQVFAYIMSPSYEAPTAEEFETPELGLPLVNLTDADEDGRYEATYNAFNEEGTYRIVIFARDTEGNLSEPGVTHILRGRQCTIERPSEGIVRISWDSELGVSYQVWSTSDLTNGDWQALGPTMGGTGDVLCVDDPAESLRCRFYRVERISL